MDVHNITLAPLGRVSESPASNGWPLPERADSAGELTEVPGPLPMVMVPAIMLSRRKLSDIEIDRDLARDAES